MYCFVPTGGTRIPTAVRLCQWEPCPAVTLCQELWESVQELRPTGKERLTYCCNVRSQWNSEVDTGETVGGRQLY